MKRGLIAAVAALVSLPGAAAAQGMQGQVYGELRGGAIFVTDSDLDFGSGLEGELSTDTGWLIEGAAGYAHGSGLRGELALGYRENDFDELELSFGGLSISGDIDGDISAVTGMANIYYDFDLGSYGGATGAMANLVPFVGGGVGFAAVEVDGDLGDEDDTAFAWQVIAGLAYKFTPNVAVTASYAYFAAENLEFDGVDAEYDSHNVLGGIRYSF